MTDIVQGVRGFAGMKAMVAVATASAFFVSSAPARADNSSWPCEVALCASNPGGWMQFGACVAPIRKLISHLATGGGFPVCSAGGFRDAQYQRPRNGRPGYVTFIKNDGSRVTYQVPSQAEVNAASGLGGVPGHSGPQSPRGYEVEQ